MFVYGFPTRTSALQFEWLWQYLNRNGKLLIENRLQELFHLLGTRKKWIRWPLRVHIIEPQWVLEQPWWSHVQLPPNVDRTYGTDIKGLIESFKLSKPELRLSRSHECAICWEDLGKPSGQKIVRCLDESCTVYAHMICMAQWFCKRDPKFLLPVSGSCPSCCSTLLWGDLIRDMKSRNSSMFLSFLESKEELIEIIDDDEEEEDGEIDGSQASETEAELVFDSPQRNKLASEFKRIDLSFE